MGQELRQELRLETTLAPLLVQSLKLLQINQLELREVIEQNLEQNPFLEKKDTQEEYEFDIPRETKDDLSNYPRDPYWRPSRHPADGKGEDYTPSPVVPELKFEEYLMDQIKLTFKKENELNIAKHIVFSLNEDGYLTEPLEEIASLLDQELKIVKGVLEKIHFLDPVGIGARDMRQSLLIQLEEMGFKGSLAYRVVDKFLNDFLAGNHTKIKNLFRIDADTFREVREIIISLVPKPRKIWGGGETQYIIPDIVVEEQDGKWTVYLNDKYIPHITVSKLYREYMSNPKRFSKNEVSYLRKKWTDANFLVSSIEKRRQTMLAIGRYIVKEEEGFLKKDVISLKLLTMLEVAEGINRNVSTVSRAIRGKYIQTPIGVFPLKKIFSAGKNKEWNKIEKRLKESIENEDKNKPLSDKQIVEILKKEGFDIARTTVVKYRKLWGIPSSNGRVNLK